MVSNRGKFISIEGGEGVGKSLFLKNLQKKLLEANLPLLVTREPGGTPTAIRLREIFNAPPEDDPLTMESEVLLVSAARSQHVINKIKPAIEKGQWVISDRFADSSRVYQGLVGKIDSEFLESVIEKTTYGIQPDLTLLLDCPVEISMNRVGNRGKCEDGETGASRYDEGSMELHKKIRNGFLTLATKYPNRIVKIDASQPPESVINEAFSVLKRKFHEDF